MSTSSLLPWRRPTYSVIVLHGTISPRPGQLNADTARPLITKAFAAAAGKPVILDIESPGGSPVQSDLIAGMIRDRADKAGLRVHAVIREVGASGGYWLACAADEIHANPMSIVGSIGVVGGGFGFPDLLSRLGVERRLYTAGRNKARLDPFSPEKPDDVAFVKALMETLHARFRDWVVQRRGARLRGDLDTLFDGSFMLGQDALARGLVDGFATVASLVEQLGGPRARIRTFAPKRRGLLSRLPKLAVDLAAEQGVDALLDALEDRAGRLTLR